MSPARIAALRYRVVLVGAFVAALVNFVRVAGGLTQAVAALNRKPWGKPMSLLESLSAVKWGDLRTWASQMDAAAGIGKKLTHVVEAHGTDIGADVEIGAEILGKLVPAIGGVLGGPAGGPLMAVITFWAMGLLTGAPVQPKDPAYHLPEGSGSISTGA